MIYYLINLKDYSIEEFPKKEYLENHIRLGFKQGFYTMQNIEDDLVVILGASKDILVNVGEISATIE